jgi:DNA-binding NtrC family response regulator
MNAQLIVLMDKEPLSRRALSRLLLSSGYPTLPTNDRASAEAALQAHRGRVTLLIAADNDGEGVQLVQELKRVKWELPAMLITSNSHRTETAAAAGCPCFDRLALASKHSLLSAISEVTKH